MVRYLRHENRIIWDTSGMERGAFYLKAVIENKMFTKKIILM